MGKNNWFFVRHELVFEVLDPQAQASFRLIEKLNRILERRGVALAVTIALSKMETYAEHLPDDSKVSACMRGFNDSARKSLQAHGVAVIDMKEPAAGSGPKRPGQPAFLSTRHSVDTRRRFCGGSNCASWHCRQPLLKKALAAVPVTEYKLTQMKMPSRQTNIRDITQFLPVGAPAYPPEENRRTVVTRAKPADTSLLNAAPTGEVALIGSSSSGDWTSFPDAMRYALQCPVLNFSINADAGPWAVVRGYLADGAFQVGQPKLIIWELPERAIGLGSNYQFRLPRFKMSSADWLLQVAALVEPDCQALPMRVTTGSRGARHCGPGAQWPPVWATPWTLNSTSRSMRQGICRPCLCRMVPNKSMPKCSTTRRCFENSSSTCRAMTRLTR